MSLLDVYSRTNELDEQSIEAIAGRLEARSGSAKYMGMLREYLDIVDIENPQRVLVLGCGTGVEVRELVRHPDFYGSVAAIDISAALVSHAKAIAAQ